MGKQDKFHDQHHFFRLGMRVRRIIDIDTPSKIMNWLYEIFTDYGYGFDRAVKWWFGHLLIGAVFLFPYKNLKFTLNSWVNVEIAAKAWGSAFISSFSNAHSFLGLNRGPLKNLYEAYPAKSLLVPFEVIWGAQAILGIAFVFFLGLTLRNRFKLN